MTLPAVRLDTLVDHVNAAHPRADPLARLVASYAAAATLTEVADHLIGHFVDEARAAGYSWTQIGEHLGVTKQAARKRFLPREVGPDRVDAAFRRYTDDARHAVVLAQDIARGHRHRAIDTEHLLLGVCAETDGAGARAVQACGVRVADLEGAVAGRLGPGVATVRGHLPFTRQASKVLDLAARQSLRLGHDRIGTEHLLLALIAEPDGIAGQVLRAAGLTEDDTRAALSGD
jgi:hypothetical protein